MKNWDCNTSTNIQKVGCIVSNLNMTCGFMWCGKKCSTDKDVACACVDEFAKFVSDEHLRHDQVYSADETALF